MKASLLNANIKMRFDELVGMTQRRCPMTRPAALDQESRYDYYKNNKLLRTRHAEHFSVENERSRIESMRGRIRERV